MSRAVANNAILDAGPWRAMATVEAWPPRSGLTFAVEVQARPGLMLTVSLGLVSAAVEVWKPR